MQSTRSIYLSFVLLFWFMGSCFEGNAQEIKIKAEVSSVLRQINIQQEIIYYNASRDTLNALYLYDWNQGYASKNTPLAERFGEEFNKSLHLAKDRTRGFTEIFSITDRNYHFLEWERAPEADLIKVQLQFPIYPGQRYTLRMAYITHLPSSEFTGYGITENGDLHLRYWYLSPALHTSDGWQLDSNKNLDDMSVVSTGYQLELQVPNNYTLLHDLEESERSTDSLYKYFALKGKERGDIKLYLQQQTDFSIYQTDDLSLITNLQAKDLDPFNKAISSERVLNFLTANLGPYPHGKLLVTETEYKKNPLYGINQLPSFIRPFEESFQYEMKLLKTAVLNMLEQSLFINRRDDHWVYDAIQTYLMMHYVEEHYPDMKMIGSLADSWLLRSFHLSELGYNDQYPFLYMLMARKNLDQPLTLALDSLVKFNEKIAGKYKAGVGLNYLSSYLGHEFINEKIKEFYQVHHGHLCGSSDFRQFLEEDSPQDISWFFEEYLNTIKPIDYRIRRLTKSEDSLQITIQNRTGSKAPITLSALDSQDSLLFTRWLTGIETRSTIRLPKDSIDRFALNYNKVIPEFNQRNNWKTTGGVFATNKSLSFQFIKDAEDPFVYQVFFVPVFNFNIYDGFTLGMRLNNKSFLDRAFNYDIQPLWATKEKSLVGSGRLLYQHYFKEGSLYVVNAGLSGATFHYNTNLRYSTITPFLSMGFRQPDLRLNERQFLTMRMVNVLRQSSPLIETDPDYSVFNTRYSYSNNGIINYRSWFADLQVANYFAKISVNWEYRKLFQNNRQFNLRLFAGKFIYNQTESDFFSFALDRPTDYLFDYNYLGRSESSGFSSQQVIIAEGGFKSKLEDPYADDWMVTSNLSFNLWKWIELYGDLGMLKKNGQDSRFVYDSGIRLNLVTDYFELYFPLYSNNGWEPKSPEYANRIRFIITISPRTLTGLFTRKWF